MRDTRDGFGGAVVRELATALGSELELKEHTAGTFAIREVASSRTWRLDYSAEQLAAFADVRAASGEEAGVGGPEGSGKVTPGVALLSIHLEEAVATASPDATKLIIDESGAVAR